MTTLNVQPVQLDERTTENPFRRMKNLFRKILGVRTTQKSEPDEEHYCLIDTIDANTAVFFQDDRRFDFIVNAIEKRVEQDHWDLHQHTIRIWCAASAAGYEAWSLAIVLNELMEKFPGLDAHILVTDTSENALAFAQRGIYPRENLVNVPPSLRVKYFKSVHCDQQHVQIAAQLKALTTFEHISPDEYPCTFDREFDFIVCRDLLSHFDRAQQQIAMGKFTRLLADGAALVIGSTEVLSGIRHSLRYVQPGIYRNAYIRN